MLTRRKFLTHATETAAFLTLASCQSLDSFITGEKSQTDHVAIIGGGVAGLMAGMTLRKAGLPFKIYEANESLGGRVQTVSFLTDSGFNGELGAEWFSKDDEIILNLAKELGLELVQIPLKENSIKWAYSLPAAAAVATAVETFPNSLKEMHTKVRNQVRFTDESQSLQDWCSKISKESALSDFFSSYCTWRYGVTADEVLAAPVLNEWSKSADSADLFLQKQIKFRNGTQNLIGAMLERVGGAFPAEVVELGSRLQSVRARASHVELNFQSLSAGKSSVVKARAVIFALPVSQISSVDGYSQLLPPVVATALAKKRMGTQVKAIYAFPDHPWKIQRLILPREQIFECSFELNPLLKVPGGVLSKMSLEGDLHSEALATFLPAENSTKVPDYIQHWALKKNIMGSHSYPAVEAPWDWAAWETDQIFWAGEHTAGERQGTLAGALASGFSAASRVVSRATKGKT